MGPARPPATPARPSPPPRPPAAPPRKPAAKRPAAVKSAAKAAGGKAGGGLTRMASPRRNGAPRLTAPVMMGGGARAAYRAGVLRDWRASPGATGSTMCAFLSRSSAAPRQAPSTVPGSPSMPTTSGRPAERLAALWHGIHADDVYRTDVLRVGVSGARWLSALALACRAAPARPVRQRATGRHAGRAVRHRAGPGQPRRRVAAGLRRDRAVPIPPAATSPSTSRTTASIPGGAASAWRSRRASASTTCWPVLHPLPVPGHAAGAGRAPRGFGDGTMRQMSPLSPAIHWRLASSPSARFRGSGRAGSTPCRPAAILARAGRRTGAGEHLPGRPVGRPGAAPAHQQPAGAHAGAGQRQRGLAPRGSDDRLAERTDRGHRRRACGAVAAHGACAADTARSTEARGAAFASYLLFEPEFTQALLAPGERDAAAQEDELAAFRVA